MTTTASTISTLDTIDAVLARRAAEAPDTLAFAESGERLSYGGLHTEAERLAGGLARLGPGAASPAANRQRQGSPCRAAPRAA